MVLQVCNRLPAPPPNCVITMPGGGTLQNIKDRLADADLPDVPGANILAQVGPALATIKPIFDIIDAIKQIFACIKAIPKAISRLSPSPILNCTADLAEKVQALLRLVPQLSGPLMIAGVLDATIKFLEGAKFVLQGLAEQIADLDDRIEAALDLEDVNLDEFLDCATDDAGVVADGVLNALEPLGSMLDVLNIILGLLGISPIELDIDEPESLVDIVQILDDVIEVLRTVRSFLP